VNRRWVLCDTCTKGFTVTQAEFYSAIDFVCAECEHKRLRLYLLTEELKSAARYGHTAGGCELCAIQNQIDDVRTGGYDWHEEYERLVADSTVSNNH
jgi:hypothetical protein